MAYIIFKPDRFHWNMFITNICKRVNKWIPGYINRNGFINIPPNTIKVIHKTINFEVSKTSKRFCYMITMVDVTGFFLRFDKITSRAAKAIFLSELCTFCWELETFHSNTNIHELQFSDMPHIVAFPRWPPLTLIASHGSKIETRSDFSEK